MDREKEEEGKRREGRRKEEIEGDSKGESE